MKIKALFAFFIACSIIHVNATNFNVTNGNDSGSGSLRQATLDAKNNLTATALAPHTITVNGAYTITLTSQLTITNHIIINASGTNLVTLNAASALRCMSISDNYTVTLNYITFQNASATAPTTLQVGSNCLATINNCTFQNNNAIIGVITSYGSINCNNSTFKNNTSSDASKALIYEASPANTLSFSNCIFQDNITQVPIIKVPASTSAITTLNITNCVFRNNANSGAVSNHGSAVSSAGITTIINTEFSGNSAQRGSAVYIPTGNVTYKSKLTMTNCTVSGNTATAYASGIYVQGTTNTDLITLTNCTISGNTSAGDGGGLAADATTTYTLNNCTITGNSTTGNISTSYGGGIRLWNGTAILNYCIVAGNNSSSTAVGKDIYLAAAANLGSTTGRNLYGGTLSFGYAGAVTTGNIVFSGDLTTILNITLADNGGSTALPGGGYVKTHALVTGNTPTAINPSAANSGLQTIDQRGRYRNSTPDIGAYECISQTIAIGSGNWDSSSEWLDNVVPISGSDIIVTNALSINQNPSVASLTINPGSKLTLNTGNTLSATTFNINSNANGTGTYLDNGTTTVSTANVQQYLTSARNWYLSSPMINAPAPAGFTYYQYNESGDNTGFASPATDYWKSVSTGTALTAGKGYIAQLATAPATITFTGTLNNGDQIIPLTRTANSTKPGFNLVGNPYPAFLNIDGFASNSVIEPTYWIRSKNGSYGFDTYNIPGNVSTNNSGFSVTANIPPMQAFWVRVKSAVSSGTITFTNSMRDHQDVANNKFRAPATTKVIQQTLRLQISNAVNSDEAVVYFNANASDSYDDYDSQKMSNDNVAIPEIYTTVGNQPLVINGLNSLHANKELPLGFRTGASNSFTIKATQITNFDADIQIVLKDKLLNKEQDITDGREYSFTSDIANTSSRFSVIFKSALQTTGIDKNVNDNMPLNIYKNANNQITINRFGTIAEEGMVTICNAIGHKLISIPTTGVSTFINRPLSSGVYFIIVNIAGNKTVKKVIIN